MSTWAPARISIAAVAVLTAVLTGAMVIGLDGSGGYVEGAVVYVLVAVVALFFPAAIAFQVVGGQLLIGALLVGGGGPAPLLLAPAVAGVIITAELLAVVARMDAPLGSHPRDTLPRTALAALIGAGVFGAVVVASGYSGPTGLVAIILASGACVMLVAPLRALHRR